MQSMGLPYETYRLAFTPGLVKQVYEDRVIDVMLENKGKYVHFRNNVDEVDDKWWIPSGHIFYSPNIQDLPNTELTFAKEHFFLPCRTEDPLGNASNVIYDRHNLLPQETHSPLESQLENITSVITTDKENKPIVAIDYRVLQPWLITDSNDNRSAVAFDILGIVVGMAIMGKTSEKKGDALNYFDTTSSDYFEPNLDDLKNYIENPLGNDPHKILNNATTRFVYDLHRYFKSKDTASPHPNVIYKITRETHFADLSLEQAVKFNIVFPILTVLEEKFKVKFRLAKLMIQMLIQI